MTAPAAPTRQAMETHALQGVEVHTPARRRPLFAEGSRPARVGQRIGLGVVGVITLLCALVAGGTLVHRIRLWPVRSAAPDVGIGHESLLVLVPVPAAKLRTGDLVVVDRKDTRSSGLYKVDALLSQVSPAIEVLGPHDKPLALNLPSTVWRVSYSVPFVGAVVKVMPGSIVTWTLIPIGVVLVASSRWSRRRRERARERNVTPAPTA